MNAKFDVICDGWIPVADADGKISTLGIRDTLERAQELQGVTDISPLTEYSIYRFLCVFLMDALRPESLADIEEMLDDGKFNMERIDTYIELCRNEGVSFDLFDEKRPFLQAPYCELYDKETKAVSAIDCMVPSGNNHTHFVHRWENDHIVSAAEGIRLLLTAQLFCTACAQEYPSGVNASPPYFAIIHGNNLMETLTLTLRPRESIRISFDEPPVLWRDTDSIIPKKEVGETSWLRGMLFPARRIRLIPTDSEGNITSVIYMQGENYVNKESWKDPFVTYRTVNQGMAPLRPNKAVPIWRNLSEIADVPGKHASEVMTQYTRIYPYQQINLTLYGTETNQASYQNVVRYDMQLPSGIGENDERIAVLSNCIAAADDAVRMMKSALASSRAISSEGIDEAATDAYSEIEVNLWTLCQRITEESDYEVPETEWQDICCAIVYRAFQKASEKLKLRGREMAQIASAQRNLAKKTAKDKRGEMNRA